MNNILIITTTIKFPDNAEDICKSMRYYLRTYPEDKIDFLIVGDDIEIEKENDIISRCNELNIKYFNDIYNNKDKDDNKDKYGYIKYLSYREQKSIFSQYPLLDNIIFTRSIQRRNIGILEAIRQRCNHLISIDDDNHPLNDKWLYDFINYKNCQYSLIGRHNGWIDIPYHITGIPSRGFPILPKDTNKSINYEIDTINNIHNDYNDKIDKIVCHQGFISGEPDRNALHRYCNSDLNINIDKFKNGYIIDKDCWCVFNTQNTLFTKQIIPLLFLFPMKKILSNGYMIERYDDIFMSYIVNKIVHRLGWYISFGYPIMMQNRNEHDTEREIFTEMTGAIIGEVFIKFLQDIKLDSNTPLGCYKEIAMKLFEYSNSKKDSVFNYLKDISKDMIIWHNIVYDIVNTNINE